MEFTGQMVVDCIISHGKHNISAKWLSYRSATCYQGLSYGGLGEWTVG